MAIIKSKHASNYTVIPNDIFNSGLSVGSIGLLAYFLSLPHDWIIYKTTVHEKLGLGREKLDKLFKELVNAGYVLSVKKHLENGKFEYEHIVYDKPYNGEPCTEKPLTDKPCTVEPHTVNQALLNTNIQSTNILNKHILNKNNKDLNFPFLDLEFKQVWDILVTQPKWKKKTPAALQATLNKLSKYSILDAIEMMNNSIAGGWQGVFELKENKTNFKPDFQQKAINKTEQAQQLLNEWTNGNIETKRLD